MMMLAASMAVGTSRATTPAGEYVMSYSALVPSCYDGGCSVTVTPIEGTDSVSIANFWVEGAQVKAHVNSADSTISIPCQAVGSDDTYGTYDIALCLTSGDPDRSAQIVGTIGSDGIITISSWWGMFANSGDYADKYLGLYFKTAIEPANAAMTYLTRETSGETAAHTFNVIVEQDSSDAITVRNFYNAGGTVEIALKSDSTATIESQLVYTDDYGRWYTCAMEYTDEYTSVAGYTSTIECGTAPDAKTVVWDSWNLISTSTGSLYWSGKYIVGGEISTTADIEYPESTTLSLQGDGTAESPYLVGSAADWNNLADYISTRYDPMTGSYVRLTADIDFSADSIHALAYSRDVAFGGDLDGNGKTLSGIRATADASYFGGIIAMASDSSRIHDLTVAGEVASGYPYTGGVVGYTSGCLERVVSQVNVSSTAIGAAGMAAYIAAGAQVTDCVSQGTVTGSGTMYTAGFAAIMEEATVTGCTNEGDVTASSAYTAGFVGRSSRGVCLTGCGNSGRVTYTGSISNCFAAGLAAAAYNGTYTGCFNEGAVTATDSGTKCAAGLFGMLMATSGTYVIAGCHNTGDVTANAVAAGLIAKTRTNSVVEMTDCYNTGRITSTSSEGGEYPTAGLVAYCPIGSAFTRCWNCGEVAAASTCYTAGLFGTPITDPTASLPLAISHCYNAGAVTGTDCVAAIIGYTPGYTTISTAYSAASVVATGTCGNIAGNNAATLEGTYYLAETAANAADTASTALTRAQLATLSLEGWIDGDDYTYPTLHEVDHARAYAAAVITADGDSYSGVTQAFNIGTPDGLTWTASVPAVEIDGNTARFTESYTGPLTMTAAAGDAEVTTELYCDVEVDGVGAVASDSLEVASEALYTPAGQRVHASRGEHGVFIVVRTRSDGTTVATTEVR